METKTQVVEIGLETETFEEAVKNLSESLGNFYKTIAEQIIECWQKIANAVVDAFGWEDFEKIIEKQNRIRKSWKNTYHNKGKMQRYYHDKPNAINLNKNIRKARNRL